MYYNYYQPVEKESRRWGVFLFAAIFALMASIGMFMPTGAAGNTYHQGFETDKSGWMDSDDEWFGNVTRVPSGDNGITSSAGDWHAVMTGDESSAPFSRFDNFRDTWQGPYTTAIDIYLDPAWDEGTGFDYSVASSSSDGSHQRDFIFHVTKDSSTEELLVAGTNNTNFSPRENLENINHYIVEDAGWYTLEHEFYNDGGQLAVDMNLLDDNGNVVFTETRTNPADTIPGEVGGNRYAWFTFINVDEGIAADEHQLSIYPTGEILSPEAGSTVSGTLELVATYDDGDEENDDAVQWAVRNGTCAVGTNTVAGNVDGANDDYNWNGADFTSTLDVSTWETGEYCFIFNPTDDPGENNVRETVEFSVVDPSDKNACKKGGWETFSQPTFRNQGDCVSWMASDNQQDNNPDANREEDL